MGIHSINHVQLGFPVGRRAEVQYFYSKLVGLDEWRPSDGRTLRFAAGSQRVDLVPAGRWQPLRAPSHLAFEVENLPGLRARFLDAGLQLDETRPLQGYFRFYANDPAGNTLEFIEPDPSQGRTV